MAEERPRRATDEIETAISSLAVNLRQVSEELAAERKARQDEKDKGVSVLRLHVPFLLWFGTIGGLIGGGIPVGLFVHSTKEHLADKTIHVNSAHAEERGGLAYQKDVEAAVSNVDTNARGALRLIVKSSPLKCQPPTGAPGRKVSKCEFLEQETPTR